MSATITEAEFVRARSQIYDLLAAIFDGDVVVLKRAIEEGAFTQLASLLPPDVDASALDGDGLDQEALKVGYDNLFVVPGPHYVPPFASAHRDEPSEDFESDSRYHQAGDAGELFGESAKDLAGLYARAGYDPSVGDGIPDHVAAGLGFMSALTTQEAAALDGRSDADVSVEDLRSLQAQTLSHLEWVDEFAADVVETDRKEGIFSALAEFTAAFLEWDAEESQFGR